MPANFDPQNRPVDQVQRLTQAGYVELPKYLPAARAQAGYFCSTCKAFEPGLGSVAGWCKGLQAIVTEFGCCNNWTQIT